MSLVYGNLQRSKVPLHQLKRTTKKMPVMLKSQQLDRYTEKGTASALLYMEMTTVTTHTNTATTMEGRAFHANICYFTMLERLL